MSTDTTPTSIEALAPRYKIGYRTDEWGERSSTPGGIPDPAGAWVRYDDHAAALARAAHAAAPKAAPARWYMINAVGMATLCADRQDAEQEAADAQAAWPHAGPHRAVQMLEVAAAPAPAAQGDALIDFIESAGSVHIYRVRAGLNGPIRWDVEYGYEDAKVSGRTLRDALSGVLKAGAARAAKEGDHDGPL